MKRVLVVGSGVVGLNVALSCLRRGFAVTLVDRESRSRRSCSFGNLGMVVSSHFVPLAAPGAMSQALRWMLNPVSPFYIKPRASLSLLTWLLRFARSATNEHVRRAAPLIRDLCLASRECYEELAAQPDADFGLVKEGLLIICKTSHAFDEETKVAAHAHELGLPAQAYAGKDAHAIEPALRDDVAGVVHYPLDCYLTPDRLIPFLEAQVAHAGGEFVWNMEIAGWPSQGNRVVAARARDGREFEADEFVLCAGAWSPQTVRDLNLALPVEAGKGYSLTLPRYDRPPAHCAILTEARVAVTPMSGGLRVGGTMELAGLNLDINAPRVRAIVDGVSRYYADIRPADFAGVEPWSGLRPCTPDGVPYIGRTRARENLTIAAGHAMMGVTLGPVTGRIVSQVLSGESPAFDMVQLSPDRFA